jgi:hypothetical protein
MPHIASIAQIVQGFNQSLAFLGEQWHFISEPGINSSSAFSAFNEKVGRNMFPDSFHAHLMPVVACSETASARTG